MHPHPPEQGNKAQESDQKKKVIRLNWIIEECKELGFHFHVRDKVKEWELGRLHKVKRTLW